MPQTAKRIVNTRLSDGNSIFKSDHHRHRYSKDHKISGITLKGTQYFLEGLNHQQSQGIDRYVVIIVPSTAL